MKHLTHLKYSNSSLVALFFLVLLPLCEAQVYKITTLPSLGGNASLNIAYGINSSGQVVGCSPTVDSAHIFVWTSTSGMQDLGVQCNDNTQPGGINDLGHLASWSNGVGGFLWSASGGFQNLGPAAFAAGVNNLDQVTGSYYTDATERHIHAFLWTPENPTLQDLGTLGGSESFAFGINNSGQVVGLAEINQNCCASFLWSASTGMQMIDGFGAAYAINDQGVVAGGSASGHAAFWTQPSGIQDLGVLPGTTYSAAYAVNNRDFAVGNSWAPYHNGFVFLWSPTQGIMLNVNTLCNNKQQNWTAVGINDAGQIAINRQGLPIFILTPIIKVALSSSLNPSHPGQSVTFTVTAKSIAGPPPDGETISFMEGTAVLGTGILSGGSASFTTSTLKAGTTLVKAVYAGDSNFAGSTSKAVSQVVVKYPTTTNLTSSLNPSNYGQAVTLTATVTSAGPTPTGKVWFKDGTTGIATMTLSGGVATLTRSKFATGTHPITAKYLGNSANATSTSAVLNQVVQ